jgi:DNA-binding IclR family transcriptional regulator
MPVDVVKSAKRVFEVLECFAEGRRPMTGAEISQVLNYPKSSTNALVHSLVSLGYLDLDETQKTFFPTIRVTLLGDWLPSMLPGAIDLEELLVRVSQRTRETVTLSAQAGHEMVFVRVLPSTYPIALNLEGGQRAHLFKSAIGLALLAALNDDQIARLMQGLRFGRSRNEMERALLKEKIQTIRTQGYAIVYDSVLPDTGAIAVALPVKPPATPIVLGVGGPVERIRSNETVIAKILLDIVAELKDAEPSKRRLVSKSGYD